MALRQMVGPELEVDEDEGGIEPGSAVIHRLFAAPTEPALTAVERQVVALGARETLGSLEAPGRIERFAAWAFGLRAVSRTLADPRLELLRRAAVVARHRHHLPDAIATELRAAGFGPERVGEIERLATGAHPNR